MNTDAWDDHPRCPHCGAWVDWDGVEGSCNNPRCGVGSISAADMPHTPVRPRELPGQGHFDL